VAKVLEAEFAHGLRERSIGLLWDGLALRQLGQDGAGEADLVFDGDGVTALGYVNQVVDCLLTL